MQSNIVYRGGSKVILRPLEVTDAPIFYRWINDREVTQNLNRTYPMTLTEEEEWLKKIHKKDDLVVGIVERQSGKLIGSMGLHNISWQHRTASTGTVIGEKSYWGKGYATEAKMLLLDVAFNALDLYAIQSRIRVTNERSIAYGRKCGYVEVGRMPQWLRQFDGTRCDEVIMVVTQERWRPLWQKYLTERGSVE